MNQTKFTHSQQPAEIVSSRTLSCVLKMLNFNAFSRAKGERENSRRVCSVIFPLRDQMSECIETFTNFSHGGRIQSERAEQKRKKNEE